MDWKIFLEKCSVAVINNNDLLSEFANSPKEWLGYEGANLSQILIAEQKLGVKLPPSYKDFLLVSNGFKQISCFLWDFLPTEKIGWLSELEPDFTNLYKKEFSDNSVRDDVYFDYSENQRSVDFKSDYLINSLAISGWGDAAIVLLNPMVKFGEEWEAWIFANWYPGARRYQSFETLMLDHSESYLRLTDNR